MTQDIITQEKLAKTLTPLVVNHAIGVLAALSEKPIAELSIKDSIKAMRPQICELLGRNYSIIEIVNALNNETDIDIKLSTFRTYVSSIDREIIADIRKAYQFYKKDNTFYRKLRSIPNPKFAYNQVSGDLKFANYLNSKYSSDELIAPRSINEIIVDLQLSNKNR